MNRTDLAKVVAKRTGLTQREVLKAIDGVIDVIAEQVAAGETVDLIEFGSFVLREWPRRKSFDVRSGTMKWKQATFFPGFIPTDGFKKRVKTIIKSNIGEAQ